MSHKASHDTSPFVLESMSGQTLWLTLNRPEQRNPLSNPMIDAILDSITRANDNKEVRVIVVTGSGPVFSAGHDLREMAAQSGEQPKDREARIRKTLGKCAAMMMGIVRSPKPIIACVQGTATAAGCQLVAACDLALASRNAQFCTPGVNIGIFCTTPLVNIGRTIHRKRAMKMALTGEMISAAEAEKYGLINDAVNAEDLIRETENLAQCIALKSPQGIRSGKHTFYQQIEMTLEDSFAFANEYMLAGVLSEDADEGVRAFFEKRAPHWKGD